MRPLLLICKGVNSTTLELNNVITCEGDHCYGPERRAGKATLSIATAVVVIVGAVSAAVVDIVPGPLPSTGANEQRARGLLALRREELPLSTQAGSQSS